MRVFDLILHQHEIKCPSCKKWIEPVTCGFYQCEYMYTGIKKDSKDSPPKKVRAPKWLRTGPTKYETYDPTKSGIVQWNNLKILTRNFTHQELERKCGICQDEVKGTGKKCGHYYHDECFHGLPEEIKTKGGCVFCVPL
jgi:hypothetical protein